MIRTCLLLPLLVLGSAACDAQAPAGNAQVQRLVAAEAPARPLPALTGRVVDQAQLLSPSAELRLTQELAALEQKTGHQVVVATLPDLQGYEIADYGAELGRVWGLRDASNDNGAILIVAPTEMKVRIEVGSAVRSELPEEVAQEIIQTWIVPSFEQGDMVNGILNGAGAIIIHLDLSPEEAAAIAAETRIDQEQARQAERESPWLALGVLFLLVIVWSIVRRFLGFAASAAGATFLLGSAGRGGGGGRFGGFGGGGAGFNGGGAGGSW